MSWELAIWPDRAQYRPGQPVRLQVRVRGPAGAHGQLAVSITEGPAEMAQLGCHIAIGPAGAGEAELEWAPPPGPGWRAFGADAALYVGADPGADAAADAGAAPAVRATTAFDVADHWQVAPRYGVLCDFGPADSGPLAAERAEQLLRLHVNVVQFYDWMYRHHTYLPPEPEFTDPLGRRLSLEAVKEKIAACRRRGMAPLAYASVYGAEDPFATEHADWLLYDGGHRPMALGPFYIQDLSPDCGWRQHLLQEYRQAMEIGFAGFHSDTYGSPRAGLARRGDGWAHVRLEEHLPTFLAEADALARERDPEGGAILNCVGGWPLEAMARAPGAALYVEVWPPMTTYRDLYELVMRARRLNPERQIVLAAYLPAFHRERAERPAGAINGLRLASAAIFASGGFHLLPTEGSGVLAHAYYPSYGHLSPDEWEALRAYWDFQTRWGPYLASPGALDVTTTHSGWDWRELRFAAEGVRFSPMAEPGTVWTLAKQGRGWWAIHLINLTGCTETAWTEPKPAAPPVRAVTVKLEVTRPVRSVVAASPDRAGGRPEPLPFRVEYEEGVGQVLQATVPEVAYWTLVLVEEG